MKNSTDELKQKSYIIIDEGGGFLKSAVLNDDGFVHHMETAIREGLKNVGCLKCIAPVSDIDYAAFFGVLWNIHNQLTINH